MLVIAESRSLQTGEPIFIPWQSATAFNVEPLHPEELDELLEDDELLDDELELLELELLELEELLFVTSSSRHFWRLELLRLTV